MDFSVVSAQGLVLCAAFFFAGIVDSVCGGGGMLTLPTFMLVRFPVRLITGTNQCSVLGGGIIGMLRFLKNGRINRRTVLPTIPATMIGAFLGARLNLILPERTLQIVLIVLLPVITVLMMIRRDPGAEDRSGELTDRRVMMNGIALGLTVGAYQAFYGAAAGTFFIIGFTVLDRLDLITASGNMRAVCLFSTIAATITYAMSGAVHWQMAAAATVFNIVGSYIGAGLALTKGAKVIRPMFTVMLIALMIRLLITLIGA